MKKHSNVTLRLPSEVHQTIALRAVLSGKTISNIVSEAVALWLAGNPTTPEEKRWLEVMSIEKRGTRPS